MKKGLVGVVFHYLNSDLNVSNLLAGMKACQRVSQQREHR
jgi:hypothetical protein